MKIIKYLPTLAKHYLKSLIYFSIILLTMPWHIWKEVSQVRRNCCHTRCGGCAWRDVSVDLKLDGLMEEFFSEIFG